MNKPPLRIAHLADTHIGMENYGRLNAETGLNQRLHDFLKSLDQALDAALAAKVDLVVFAGDIYKTRDPTPTHQRDSRTLLPDCGGMRKATRSGHTNRLSRTKAPRARGCTPTYIARKAIRATPHTGIAVQANQFAENRSMGNGSASSEACLNNPLDHGQKRPEGLGAAGAFPRRWRAL